MWSWNNTPMKTREEIRKDEERSEGEKNRRTDREMKS